MSESLPAARACVVLICFDLYDIAILLEIAGAGGSVVRHETTPAPPSKFLMSVRVAVKVVEYP